MKYKKGDRVRVTAAYLKSDPNYGILVGKVGMVTLVSSYVNVRLENVPVDLDQVWLFEEDELELVDGT